MLDFIAVLGKKFFGEFLICEPMIILLRDSVSIQIFNFEQEIYIPPLVWR
jgi:hypothetical protein